MNEALELLSLTAKHPRVFFEHLSIADKDGTVIPFGPNLHPEQEQLIELYLDSKFNNRNLALLKGRQVGASTLFAMLAMWEWWRSPGATNHVFFLHVHLKARKFARAWALAYGSLPPELRALRPCTIKTEALVLNDTGAELSIATAGGHGGSRSATITTAICSEYPFWDTTARGCANILSSISGSLTPGGTIVLESTAAYHGDALHQYWTNPKDKWATYFSAWTKHPEYRTRPPEGWVPEPGLEVPEGLSRDQLYWWVNKYEELSDLQLVKREFPTTVQDAYDTSSGNYFQAYDLRYIQVEQSGRHEWRSKNPGEGPFALGGDGAFGVGGHDSAIVVVNVRTGQPVYRWSRNDIEPEEYARIVAATAQDFKFRGQPATVLVESNQPGDLILKTLRDPPILFPRLWSDPDHTGTTNKDWTTSDKTKTRAFASLKRRVTAGEITSMDSHLYDDVCHLLLDPKGRVLTPEKPDGSHCDTAMAAALAYVCAESVTVPKTPAYNPFR